ncbi:MAG: elongation factor P [Candidatus Omnitrophica bacterium]|nr:elongation factor P [Candidatus Omnitrophota bacterium]MDD5670458.1 elongation factor P [Candidatus Omnitrophota bacterium]
MIGANELKRKMVISVEREPYMVLEVNVAAPSARGAQTMVKARLRHLLTGAVSDRSFKAGERFDEPDVEKVEASFLYRDDQGYCFMEESTYEQHYLDAEHVGEARPYLTEGLVVTVLKYNGAIASLQLPVYVNLKVTATDAVRKGDAGSSSGMKPATLETGLEVRVPPYIAEGEVVRVNTETGEVAGRAV